MNALPRRIVIVKEIPKGPTGKLQRTGMAEALGMTLSDQAARRSRAGSTVPLAPPEKKLAEIWCEVLGVEEVGLHDDFFDLSGNSLLASQIVYRINRVFSVQLTLREFFEALSVSRLAAVVAATGTGTHS